MKRTRNLDVKLSRRSILPVRNNVASASVVIGSYFSLVWTNEISWISTPGSPASDGASRKEHVTTIVCEAVKKWSMVIHVRFLDYVPDIFRESMKTRQLVEGVPAMVPGA